MKSTVHNKAVLAYQTTCLKWQELYHKCEFGNKYNDLLLMIGKIIFNI